ncbi:MAG: type I polyketide synthase, partial [Thiohalocapsa sp.]
MAEPAPPSAEAAIATIDWLRPLVARHAGLLPDALDPEARLNLYGLSSLTGAALAAEIGERLGRTLPPTLVWDHPTLRQLAAFLDGAAGDDARPAPLPLAKGDAIAIVGLACRLPGGASPSAYWRMLCGGVDAITEVPPERWPIDALYDPDPQAPGRMATRWGGFISDIDQFDAEFFGLSPREASQADPQQRLALELAWEALEDAAIRPRHLVGSRSGVFIGAMWSDYARLLAEREAIAPHTATGQDTSIISARIAYALGLAGPALTINTACSSALVAVHQACRSLRAGESTLALAGGVHLLLAPESSIAMTKFGAMAPDGRCKAFDAGADGYVRGEGGGIVVLQPLSLALREGRRIYAVIRGGAVNNDGASNGLTAPNPAAQRAMLRDALFDAGIAAARVDYVEAHGTGTALGDPIEANALAAVLGVGRLPERPLVIGSVKTNIGHLEAAAGAAGLIKLALALHHRWIPPSLHFHTPNPAIDVAAAVLQVQTSGAAWPPSGEPPVGGVSSFGFGGTNCHLLLEAAPAAAPAAAAGGQRRPVFVFAGNGGNWPGMAAALLENTDFADSLRQSEAILQGAGYPASVVEVLADARVEDVALGQPALCAFQLALADLLADLGIRPAAVIGHSVGEAAAAAVAGILPRAAALRLVVLRSRLQAGVAGNGAMALAAAAAEALAPLLPDGVVIAGENGPRATLLSGSPTAVAAACRALDRAGIVSHNIAVPVAYHSPQMDPLRPLLEAELADLAPVDGGVAMVSTVTGGAIAGRT